LLLGLRRPKRELYVWTLLSALCMLLIASVLSFYFGLQRFLNPEEIQNILYAYLALVIAISSNGYAFYLSAKRILGKQKPIKLWKAFSASKNIMTKNTFVLDLMGMSAAVVGLVALLLYQLAGERRFDGLGAMAIGVVLAFLAVDLILDIRRMHARGADVKP
jgi:divalent metal cation (Fe/Co/Zn/Cd) transporter